MLCLLRLTRKLLLRHVIEHVWLPLLLLWSIFSIVLKNSFTRQPCCQLQLALHTSVQANMSWLPWDHWTYHEKWPIWDVVHYGAGHTKCEACTTIAKASKQRHAGSPMKNSPELTTQGDVCSPFKVRIFECIRYVVTFTLTTHWCVPIKLIIQGIETHTLGQEFISWSDHNGVTNVERFPCENAK